MAENEFITEGKRIAEKGHTWLSTASTSTLAITGIALLVLFVTGLWKSILSLVIVIALGVIAYFSVVSWQKSKKQSAPHTGGSDHVTGTRGRDNPVLIDHKE